MRIIALAREDGPGHYFLFRLMGERGLRVGSITGIQRVHNYRVKDGSPRTVTVDLPGLRKEDVREDGLVVHMKGHRVVKVRVDPGLLSELREYAGTLGDGEKIVDVYERKALRLIKEYAEKAGIEHPEHVYPHMLRHSFGTLMARKTGRDPWKVRDMMGHASVASSNRYVQKITPEEEEELLR